MKLTPGTRLKSAVCDTESVVVRPPKTPGALSCGGAPMIAYTETRAPGGAPAEGHTGGSLLGKRYADDGIGIEVLCSKAGQGSLSYEGTPLAPREAKKLPASD